MNLESEKLELMHRLLETRKESVLVKLRQVFEEEETTLWDEMSQEEKEEIRIGLAQADQGDTVSNEKVMKVFEKWHIK